MALNRDKMADQARLYLATWTAPPAATHAGADRVNRYVEAARASPYTAGHAAAFHLPPVLYARIILKLFNGETKK
jgi:hypothetical protein